jgi:starch-binding outer membrane protein, SusD/RagB family
MKKIFVLLFSLSLLSSCDDALDIVQDGELNDAALFTSINNMQLFLNETYDRVSIQNDIMVSSRLTDEVGLGNAGFPDDTHRFFVFSTNGFASAIWNQHYQAINYANRLLRGAALYQPKASEQADYDNIIAQARAIRAFSHFQLLVYFSTDLSNDNAPGVMKLDFVPTTLQLVPRSTNGVVFQLIENDLAFAEGKLTMPTTGANNWRYINVNMVNALRARMYLYRKNYTLAEQYADAVINTSGIALATCTFTLPANFPATSAQFVVTGANTGSSSFDTAPSGSNTAAVQVQTALFNMDRWTATTASPTYRKMWVDGVQGEAIFSLARPNNATNFSSQYNTNQSYTLGGPLYDMGRTLYDLYTQPLGGGAQDFRRWAFVDRSATVSATPATATKDSEVIVIDKYPGKVGSHNSNDLKVFRLSEMYFIKAECRVMASDLAGAANLVRLVRQARNYIATGVVPTPVYANATAAFADILLERRKELCFEGHRYIDLKRMGALAGVTQTDRSSTDAENASAIDPSNIQVNDYRFTLPIPQNEINVNPMPQNPNY